MELGGDLYDIKMIDENRLGVAIGDASGKGIPGAILMSALYAAFKTGSRKSLEVNEIIGKLNNSVVDLTQSDKYATFFYGILNISSGIFEYTNAGHNHPYLVRISGKVEELGTGGTVLGFFKEIEYKMDKVKLEVGDRIVLFTDGVTECMNEKDEEFGEKRLLDILIRNVEISSKKLEEKIINSLRKFAGEREFSDDVTLVTILKKEN